MLNDPAINAFAGPGGDTGVDTGLILASGNESELTGMLAHQIAHVIQRHLARAFTAANKLSLPSMAAMTMALKAR